jgi:hypothetical protein
LDKVEVAYLEPGLFTDVDYDTSMRDMLGKFHAAYKQADVVTGHYIRVHDLPIINGALREWMDTSLEPKDTVDTKLDLIRWSGFAKTQENLGLLMAKFEDGEHLASKEHMTQMDWRRANRLTLEGVEETKRRVVGDVKQHKELRAALHKHGMLKPGKVWRP